MIAAYLLCFQDLFDIRWHKTVYSNHIDITIPVDVIAFCCSRDYLKCPFELCL